MKNDATLNYLCLYTAECKDMNFLDMYISGFLHLNLYLTLVVHKQNITQSGISTKRFTWYCTYYIVVFPLSILYHYWKIRGFYRIHPKKQENAPNVLPVQTKGPSYPNMAYIFSYVGTFSIKLYSYFILTQKLACHYKSNILDRDE